MNNNAFCCYYAITIWTSWACSCWSCPNWPYEATLWDLPLSLVREPFKTGFWFHVRSQHHSCTYVTVFMKSCHRIFKKTFGVYMFSLLLFDFIKNQFWTVKWRLLLNEEDGGSCFAFGFGKKETFYLFVICYVLIHSQMCFYKCMYYVILLHCCFYEMPVFQNY